MLRRAILAIGLFGISPCLAAGWSEHWTATSDTASSITGDVTLKTSQIIFADGKTLPIQKLKNVSFTDDIGKTAPATIYQITKPADPVLLQGNRICGGAGQAVPVTFVVIWHAAPIMPGMPVGRAFAAYSGATAPAPSVDGACGVYRYEIAK